MPAFAMRLFTDRLPPNASTEPLAAHNRAIYVMEGDAVILAGRDAHDIGTNEARFVASTLTLRAGMAGATLLRWELASKLVAEDGLARGAGIASDLTFSHDVALHPWTQYMMRCDRVDFPPGGKALTHIHPGPGIRCLVQGRITIRTSGRDTSIEKGKAWFELGPEPVFAKASEAEQTAFARVMILPRDLYGKNSIHYVNPEDREKPKTQRYTGFFDEFIEV